MTIVLGAAGQLPRLSFRGRGEPDIGCRLIARQVDGRKRVRDERTIRAHLRIGHAPEAEEVIDGHGPLAVGARSEPHEDVNQNENTHNLGAPHEIPFRSTTFKKPTSDAAHCRLGARGLLSIIPA